jgi:hypothetical protein
MAFSMLTKEKFLADLLMSQQREEATYKRLTLELYKQLQEPLKSLYDEAIRATVNFTAITAETIQQHPRIIKILRYCLTPVISQMRLGQIVGVGTTRPFEVGDARPSDAVAAEVGRWVENYLDRERFPWTSPAPPDWSPPERSIAEHYAKLCTVALVSNQNTDTLYRMNRQRLQEEAIADVLRSIGLAFQAELGPPRLPQPRRKKGDPPQPPVPRRPVGISKIDDVQAGHFVTEKVILAGLGRNQKSDLTARPIDQPALLHPPRLFCIEAKAVGIRIDSAKRLKELNDKFTDWAGSAIPITTIGVCSGFFNLLELMATIRVRGIPIFFEHDLAPLGDFLKSGNYHGAPWDPTTLFADIPQDQLQEALGKITSAKDDEDEMPPEAE